MREFASFVAPLRLGIAIAAVRKASRKPSGISFPAASRTASLYMWWPTWRTNMSERPGSTIDEPSGAV